MQISEFDITVEHKAIKNIHLAVYPPDGRVHISVPVDMKDEEVSFFLYSKLSWIRTQYRTVVSQERQSPRQYVSGENHYLFGNRYLLRVIPTVGAHHIELKTASLDMYVRESTSIPNRQALMNSFYRSQLQPVLEQMVTNWSNQMGEDVTSFRWQILTMRQQWGSCSTQNRSIRYNLLLARVPRRCIEYVVVHELAHLKVHEHDIKFRAILDAYLPDWQQRKKELDEFVILPTPDIHKPNRNVDFKESDA